MFLTLVVILFILQASLYVINGDVHHQHNNYNIDNIIPLQCWNDAKNRFRIGNKGVWGPQLWHSLHCTALNYPSNPSEIDKQNYKSFYENVHRIIPCPKCAHHYKQNIVNFDLNQCVNSPLDLFKFTVNIHNLVNAQLNKESVAADDALKLYQGSCAKCRETPHDLEALINGLQPQNLRKDDETSSPDKKQIIKSLELFWGNIYRLGLVILIIITLLLMWSIHHLVKYIYVNHKYEHFWMKRD